MLNVEIQHFVNNYKSSIVYTEELNRLVADRKLKMPELDVLKGRLSAVERGCGRRRKRSSLGLQSEDLKKKRI